MFEALQLDTQTSSSTYDKWTLETDTLAQTLKTDAPKTKNSSHAVVKPCTTKQCTVAQIVHLEGVGLHSGEKIEIRILPQKANTGIVFHRIDVEGKDPYIPALYNYVNDTKLNSCICNQDGVSVRTIEHLMAALFGLQIDNAMIEINGGEVPAMDGSADEFVQLLDRAGRTQQAHKRKQLVIKREVSIDEGDFNVSIKPADDLVIGIEIDFQDQVIGLQKLEIKADETSFRDEIASARTFGMLHEVSALRKAGLAIGGSLKNAIVINDGKVMNEEGLRFDDEFVRHKILDCMGDLALSGGAICGYFTGYKCGHKSVKMLLDKVFSDPKNYSWQ